jgi:hypothetical protein
MRSRAVRRSTISSPAARACSASASGSRPSRCSGSGPRKNSMSSKALAGTDVLGEVGAARSQHASDLVPVDRGRVTAGHEVEGRVREGQGRLIGIGDHGDAAPVQQLGGARDVRRPGLGGDGEGGEARRLGEHLSPAGLDVERGRRPRQALAEQARIPPGRALLGGAAVEPREVPAGDVGLRADAQQLVERCGHGATLGPTEHGRHGFPHEKHPMDSLLASCEGRADEAHRKTPRRAPCPIASAP